MIILSNTTDSLEVVLASAITTNQLRCFVSYRDTTATTIAPNRAVANTNSTTPVTLLSAPSASEQKIVDYLSVYNADTVNAVVTVYINSSSTTYKLLETTLGAGEKLEFQEGTGFRCLTSDGSLKVGDNQGIQSVSNTINSVVLSSNVAVTTIAYANVTGLQFAMTAGETYWFKFVLAVTSSGAANWYRYAVNSAATASYLSYLRIFPNGASATVIYTSKDYDSAEAATGTSVPAGMIATMEGVITASTSGNLIARVGSETAGQTITTRAGSLVYYQRIN